MSHIYKPPCHISAALWSLVSCSTLVGGSSWSAGSQRELSFYFFFWLHFTTHTLLFLVATDDQWGLVEQYIIMVHSHQPCLIDLLVCLKNVDLMWTKCQKGTALWVKADNYSKGHSILLTIHPALTNRWVRFLLHVFSIKQMSWQKMSACSWQHWEWGSGMTACITLRCIWRLPVWDLRMEHNRTRLWCDFGLQFSQVQCC